MAQAAGKQARESGAGVGPARAGVAVAVAKAVNGFEAAQEDGGTDDEGAGR